MLRFALTALLLTLTLTPAMADTATELVIVAGTEVPLPHSDTMIRLTGVQDVRCPSDVDCYWEGLIKIELTLTDAKGAMHDIVLCNLCDDATREAVALGYRFTFVRLEPGRDVLDHLDRPVFMSDYRLFLTVAAE